jgi:hypothetical protein
LRGKIQADYATLLANFVSRQNDVYPGTASKIHDHLTGLEVGKTGGVAAASGKIDPDFGNQRKLFMAIKRLVNRKARTGLVFARSTGLAVAARFSKIAVAGHNGSSDFLGYHLFHSLYRLSRLCSICSWLQAGGASLV